MSKSRKIANLNGHWFMLRLKNGDWFVDRPATTSEVQSLNK